VLTALCVGCDRDRDGPQTGFIAYSLREASAQANAKEQSQTLLDLGGITRIAGIVHDQKGNDIILVGMAAPGLPEARFDDLVVALRARLRYNEFPLVSIDTVEDTAETKLQRVRFDGHLENTPFGSELLKCDILLKRYSLQQMKQVASVRPFNVLIENDLRGKAEQTGVTITSIHWRAAAEGDRVLQTRYGRDVVALESYQARFWFREQEPYYAACKPDELRPEIFCIRKLKLCVQSESKSISEDGQQSKYRAQELFAKEWTEHFDEMCEQYPQLRRLKVLFDLVAVADVIRVVHENVAQQPYLAYLLHDYSVSTAPTDPHYKLQELYGIIDRSDGQEHLLRISGGIELRPQIRLLNYGDVTQLRSIVLNSRPSDRSLTWRLPLDGWNMPNAGDLGLLEEDAAKTPTRVSEGDAGKAGCSILCESVVLNSGTTRDDERRYYAFGPPPPPPPGAILGDDVKRFYGFGPPPPPFPPLGGVCMRMVVTEESFTDDKSGALDADRTDVIQSRPDNSSMSWKSNGKGSRK